MISAIGDTMFSRPPVFSTREALAELRAIAAAAGDASAGAELFKAELSRLTLLPDVAPPAHVRLNSQVTYKDLRTKRVRCVRLTPPGAADPDENRVSILSPIGAALIGLAEGAVFRWHEPDGRLRAVKVLLVEGDAS